MDIELQVSIAAIRSRMNRTLVTLGAKLRENSQPGESVGCGIIETLLIDQCGKQTSLSQLAMIAMPHANLIEISPYDPSLIKNIKNKVDGLDLGLTAIKRGEKISVNISKSNPPDVTGRLKVLGEQANMAIRAVARSNREDLILLTGDTEEVSEILMDLVDDYTDKISKIVKLACSV